MRIVMPICLLLLPATGALAQEPREAPWVCVPTETFGWVCGRGADAPAPRHLPVVPAPVPESLPAYQPPAQSVAEALLPPVVEDVMTPESTASPASAETGPTEASDPNQGRQKRDLSTPVADATAVRNDDEAQAASPPRRPANGGPRYGIQLAAMRDAASLDDFIRVHRLEELDTYRRTWRDAGGVWYVLLTGRFFDASQARRALAEMAPQWRQSGAWVRRVDQLQRP